MYNFKKHQNSKEMCDAMVDSFVYEVNNFLKYKDSINVAIATGSTLEPFILRLKDTNLPFEKINLYIVDDYAGISFDDERSCSIDLFNFFENTINKFKTIKLFSKDEYINDISIYNEELKMQGLDICVLGVGIDGHVGFCYPPIIKYNHFFYEVLELSKEVKNEHVNNGWFLDYVDVPNKVITLTLWGMLQSSCILVGAVFEDKMEIIKKMYECKTAIDNCPILFLSNHINISIHLG